MENFIQAFTQADAAYINVYQQILRYCAPLLVGALLFLCIKPLLTFRREPEIWAWLVLEDQRRLPITHWESVIGRNKRSDVVINMPAISRNHAVLTRYDDGSWTIADAGSKAGVLVNGERVDIAALEPEDVIDIAGVKMKLLPISRRQEIKLAFLRTKGAHPLSSLANVLLLTLIQVLVCCSYLLTVNEAHALTVFWGFAGIAISQWALLIFYFVIRKPSFEVETIAFLLCTMGMAAIAAVRPGEAMKQLIAMFMGLALFLGVGWSLRDLERAKKIRYIAAAAGIGFLLITLLFGREYHGAKNWLVIGGMSFQPSELSKMCFVFVGASTMDRIVNRRNLILFIGYTLAICGCLAVMNDFGTALIFFIAFLLIAYMRSGSVGTLALACTSLGFAGVIALKIAPHAMRRFSSWRHIWEDPLGAGYQQTRALMCIASGGLFGMGAGRGWMKNVFAADSDVVIATLAEEWGLLIVLMLISCILALGLFAVRSAAVQRSSFFAIGGCTAAGILLVQAIFNALGTVDVLPLTGVTFPFVSNGGSSMIGAWGLLAFVKAADTRQSASFAVRQSKEGRPDDE
ncbi:MAG: FtsW/RodA/SpoVE family cell cycle protein [Oscillospiraceae bacterium]|nr:FtsW/RodA/SpoVE family cell cycle protein [Oscillospiraceae bacterium]